MQNKPESTSDWIKKERGKRGLTQRELADLSEIPRGTIAGIEGGIPVGKKTMRKLEAFFSGQQLNLGERCRNVVQNFNKSHQAESSHSSPSNSNLELIAELSLQENYLARVDSLSDILKISRISAAVVLFETALKENEKK